jgi:hypothetical protein
MYYFLGVFPKFWGFSVMHYGTGWIYSGWGWVDWGPRTEGQKGVKMGQKVILRFNRYRPFRGKRCFYFLFCEI